MELLSKCHFNLAYIKAEHSLVRNCLLYTHLDESLSGIWTFDCLKDLKSLDLLTALKSDRASIPLQLALACHGVNWLAPILTEEALSLFGGRLPVYGVRVLQCFLFE